jgi:hypothetical protein
MVRIAEITEDMEEFLKSGYFDPDDEEIIYAADPMWENHRVYRPLTDIAWIEIRFVDFVGEIDSNKGAASLLKKR